MPALKYKDIFTQEDRTLPTVGLLQGQIWLSRSSVNMLFTVAHFQTV